MKQLIPFTLLAVLVSCGGSSGGSSNKGSYVDPITADKIEEQIRDQRVGMVTITSSSGTTLDISTNQSGTIQGTTKPTSSVQKETVLKVDGDTVYVLEEDTDEDGSHRQVTKQSIEQMVRESTQAKPGTNMRITTSGNSLVMTMVASGTQPLQSGPNDSFSYTAMLNLTADINNIRCTGKTNGTVTYSVTMNGRTTRLPDTSSNGTIACGKDLTQAQLQALSLTNISLCDETNGTPTDDQPSNCQYGLDLSYLVK